MDYDVLVALYNSASGSTWTHRDGWLDERIPLDQWHGVQTNASGRVVGLALGENQLEGTIAREIGELERLERLELQGNRLSGPIPRELGNVSALTRLSLYENQLSGEIPPELGELTALKYLRLDANLLIGEIPSELGNLRDLERLWLNRNQLTGEIPRELFRLKSLTGLGLFRNKLTGGIPAEIGNLSRLDILGLDRNELTGEIPIGLTELASLRLLWLDHNRLSGRIPPEIGKLKSLTRLWLGDNQLSGPVPRELASLPLLELVSIGGNPQLEGDRAVANAQLEGGRRAWNVFDLGAHILPEDSDVGLLWGLQDDEPGEDDASSLPSASAAAALHLFAITPIELYRPNLTESVRRGLSSSSGWKVDETSDLSKSIEDTITRLSLKQSGPAYVTEELIPSTQDRVIVHAILVETGVCLLFHTTSRLTTGTRDARTYLRSRWALSLTETPPGWVEEQLPRNSESALYRAVWLWIYRRYRQRWWADAIHDLAVSLSAQIMAFAEDLDGEESDARARAHRAEGRATQDQTLELIQTDALRVFAFDAWDESSMAGFSSEIEWAEVGSDERVDRYREMWRDHFPTTARALDILDAIDDEVPPLSARHAAEFRGIYGEILQTGTDLRGLLGQGGHDLNVPGLLDEGAFTLVTRDIVARMSSWNLQEVLGAITEHRDVRQHQYPIRSNWYDIPDGDNRLLLLARDESLEIATVRTGHINDIVAMEIALQSAWNKFEHFSWNLDIILRDTERTDITEGEALRQLSELALRVAGWRTRLSGWQRATLQHLRSVSRLDENIEAFFKASEEYVRRESLVREEQQAERERKFQRVVTMAGIALAAIVLGEITISIAGGSGSGRVEASVATIVAMGSAFICPWLVASTFDDWSPWWKSWGVVVGFAFLAGQVSGLARWAGWVDEAPAFYLFGAFWWLWPGLPLLGLSVGAALGCVFRAREAGGEIRAAAAALASIVRKASGHLGRLLRPPNV
jgi:hypothetical protein